MSAFLDDSFDPGKECPGQILDDTASCQKRVLRHGKAGYHEHSLRNAYTML